MPRATSRLPAKSFWGCRVVFACELQHDHAFAPPTRIYPGKMPLLLYAIGVLQVDTTPRAQSPRCAGCAHRPRRRRL